ncbi:hypothetical protein ACVWW5_002237 [Bradyrhizobium sp. LM3.4]
MRDQIAIAGHRPFERRCTDRHQFGARMAQGAHHHGSANEAIDPLLRQGVEDGFEGHGIGDPQLSEGIDEFGLNALDLGLS